MLEYSSNVLLGYGFWNALSLDGRGLTSMALRDQADLVRKVINVSRDAPAEREQVACEQVTSGHAASVT